ncbi:hypothetical protein BH10BDE1_BH10BDE1_34760 [soil metagenome]
MSPLLRKLLKDRSLAEGLGVGLAISTAALLMIEVLFRWTGVYFTPICIVCSMVAALACGFVPSILVTILLTFSTDYLYIPPIGSILDTKEGIEHFFIIMFSCVTVSLVTSMLRGAVAKITKLNLELQRQNMSVLEASRLKSEFLANMSHEIRTPMNGIIGMTELLRQTPLEDHQKHYTDSIASTSEHLLGLINTILDLSKVEAGKLELEIKPFDLQQLLGEMKATFAPLAALRGLDFKWDVSLAEDRYFSSDSSRLRQIFTNLLGNALKFTGKGSIGIRVEVVKSTQLASSIRFGFTDTGIGISTEVQQRLFQVFSQGDASTARRYGGTGLGLAISKQLAELFEGKIEVQSEPGRGSIFSFTVTLAKIAKEYVVNSKAVREPATNVTRDQRRSARILLAEDNVINQEITATILRHAGYTVEVVDSGQDVLDSTREGQYLAVVMDCQMPEMDGYEATGIMRARGFDRPIIALTANAFQADRDRCFEVGMTAYLSKPAFADQLLPILDNELLKLERLHLDTTVLDRLRAVDLDDTLLKNLLSLYSERMPIALEELSLALENRDAEAVRKSAHALRASNANLGANRVAEILLDLETNADQSIELDVTEKRTTMAKLTYEIEAARSALAAYIEIQS